MVEIQVRHDHVTNVAARKAERLDLGGGGFLRIQATAQQMTDGTEPSARIANVVQPEAGIDEHQAGARGLDQ